MFVPGRAANERTLSAPRNEYHHRHRLRLDHHHHPIMMSVLITAAVAAAASDSNLPRAVVRVKNERRRVGSAQHVDINYII